MTKVCYNSFMKKFLLILIIFLLSVAPVSAHLIGQPPFFKVNGVYSNFYPVSSYSSDQNKILPQDYSSGAYVVNEPISFELDKSQLETIVPKEIVAKTDFLWDFGDGAKGKGLANKHVYTKPGGYTLNIFADTSTFEQGVQAQLLQSTYFNVLPDKNYKIPQAVMLVNGQKVTVDQATGTTQDVFDVNFKEPVHFDASTSVIGSSKVVSYEWDFGDGKTATGTKVNHTYVGDAQLLTPVLTLTDEKGFISETSVGIKNNGSVKNDATTANNENGDVSSSKEWYISIGVAVLALLAVGFFIRKNVKRK